MFIVLVNLNCGCHELLNIFFCLHTEYLFSINFNIFVHLCHGLIWSYSAVTWELGIWNCCVFAHRMLTEHHNEAVNSSNVCTFFSKDHVFNLCLHGSDMLCSVLLMPCSIISTNFSTVINSCNISIDVIKPECVTIGHCMILLYKNPSG